MHEKHPFLRGMVSLFDFSPRKLNPYAGMTEEEKLQADANALKGDWEAVGGDLRKATEKLLHEFDTNTKHD